MMSETALTTCVVISLVGTLAMAIFMTIRAGRVQDSFNAHINTVFAFLLNALCMFLFLGFGILWLLWYGSTAFSPMRLLTFDIGVSTFWGLATSIVAAAKASQSHHQPNTSKYSNRASMRHKSTAIYLR